MDTGHVNRDGRHFPTPLPLFSPSPLHHGAFKQRGERRGRGMESIVTFGPLHNCSCTSHASAHLQLESNPNPNFHFRFQIFLLCENSKLTLGWSEYIQESGQLPIGGDLAEYRRAIAVSTEGNFWAILPAAVCRRSPNLTPC